MPVIKIDRRVNLYQYTCTCTGVNITVLEQQSATAQLKFITFDYIDEYTL